MSESLQIPVVLLCGGRGTRLGETAQMRPKPLVEVGGMPILWHIMSSYARQGFKKFILCLGYKGAMIEQYFHDYPEKDWSIEFVDTGAETQTGGRVRRIEPFVNSEHFMLTYADGVSDIDINALLQFHLKHGKCATVSAVRPPSQYGILSLEGDRVLKFAEKPQGQSYINGGFFVFRKSFFKLLDASDKSVLEREPLERAAAQGELRAFRHDGFWQSMDTPKDWELLNELYREGKSCWLDAQPVARKAVETGASLKYEPLPIAGAYRFESILRSDERGFFGRIYCADTFHKLGLETQFVQQNHNRSLKRGIFRGFHYQLPPHSEAKLVRCTHGKIVDVIVDVRAGSPTFLKWHMEPLEENDHKMVYVPPGCAHGFLSLTDNCEITYPVSNRYSPRHERGIRFNDPRINIQWPIPIEEIYVSEKDRNMPLLDESFKGAEL